MGKRLTSLFMAAFMVIALPVFSFSAEKVVDSGAVASVSSFSARASEEISLLAAADVTGKYGYNIEPYLGMPNVLLETSSPNVWQLNFRFDSLPTGVYSFSADFNYSASAVGGFAGGSGVSGSAVVGQSVSFTFNNSSQRNFIVLVQFPRSSVSDISDITYSNVRLESISPVEGISCGYSFNDSFSLSVNDAASTTFTWDFGDQPAGNYIVNIYHYGLRYDCSFDVTYGSSIVGTNSRFLPTERHGSVTSCFVSHGGGNLTLSGTANYWYQKDSSLFEGSIAGSTNLGGYLGNDYANLTGGFASTSFLLKDENSWAFSITDVIAVPFDSAGLEQFGVFGGLVGYLRDAFFSLTSSISSFFSNLTTSITTQFTQLKTALSTHFSNLQSHITSQLTSVKNHITTQFTQLKTLLTDLFVSDEAESDVESAQEELDKEVAELNEMTGNLQNYAGNIESQMQSDFAVSDEIMGQTGNAQTIWTGLFSSFGLFSIFFWLPPLLAVIRYVLRL